MSAPQYALPTTTEIYMNLSPEDMLREYRDKW